MYVRKMMVSCCSMYNFIEIGQKMVKNISPYLDMHAILAENLAKY